jgi:PAS domain S-box-containing protein
MSAASPIPDPNGAEPHSVASADKAAVSVPEPRSEDDAVNILIVDDEPKNLLVLETVLDQPGYRLIRATSAEQALLALLADEFALLILDISMPGMNGFELAQMVKERKKTALVPIIFLTAYYNEDQHAEEGYITGAVDYLYKPVNPVILRSKVNVFVELHRKSRELGFTNRTLHAEISRRRRFEEELRLLNETLEQRVAERTDAVRQNQVRLRHAADAARLAYLEVDFITGRARASENFQEVMGYALPHGKDTDTATSARLLMRHVVPQDYKRLDAALREAATGRPVAMLDYRIVGDDCVERWIESEWFVEFSADGSPLKSFVTNLDITAQKTVQLRLRESEESYRQLADSMPQMVWTARPDGQFDYYNKRWREYTGFGGELFGDLANWAPILHPHDAKHSLNAWYAAVHTGEAYLVEYRLRDKRADRYRWHLGRALPVRNEDGRIIKWIGTSTDIDEQKRSEEDLRRANRALEQFAFAVAHDLQEPVRNITVFAQLLAKSCDGRLTQEAQHFLSIVVEGAHGIGRLVSDLLTYMQTDNLEGGSPAAVDCEAVFQRVLKNLGTAVEESQARITHDSLSAVRMKDVHLEQLLQNLIGNALKYRKDNKPPQVHVSASRQDSVWLFSVRDNGIGIAPEYRELVFGVFKRLHQKGGKYPGTGMGLAICQKIVESYGGRIWAESELGAGSTFHFTVPVGAEFGTEP